MKRMKRGFQYHRLVDLACFAHSSWETTTACPAYSQHSQQREEIYVLGIGGKWMNSKSPRRSWRRTLFFFLHTHEWKLWLIDGHTYVSSLTRDCCANAIGRKCTLNVDGNFSTQDRHIPMMNHSFNLSLIFYAVQITPIDRATGIEPDARSACLQGRLGCCCRFFMFFPFMKQRKVSTWRSTLIASPDAQEKRWLWPWGKLNNCSCKKREKKHRAGWSITAPRLPVWRWLMRRMNHDEWLENIN